MVAAHGYQHCNLAIASEMQRGQLKIVARCACSCDALDYRVVSTTAFSKIQWPKTVASLRVHMLEIIAFNYTQWSLSAVAVLAFENGCATVFSDVFFCCSWGRGPDGKLNQRVFPMCA